jgi:hypothetical protein
MAMSMKRITHRMFGCFAVVLATSGTYAQAQTTDMWQMLADKQGLFSPHANNCSSTEVYVTIGGGVSGFCMEKDERSADYWENAKETCASVGKRLPEPAEFKYACKNPPTGLIHMTNNYEWVSNAANWFHYYDGGNSDGIFAATLGNGSCANGQWGNVVETVGGGREDSNAFRCVH